MHLVPTDLGGRRVLDGERLCQAIDALGDPGELDVWAERFRLLGDRTRLAVLLSIANAGPIAVTDLATATGVNDCTVSHCLALLRATGTVVRRRDGRVIRYQLNDPDVAELLQRVAKPAAPGQWK